MLRRRYFYLTYAAVSLIYIIASLLAPLEPTRFNLTPAKTHLLQLTIYLPIVIIWGMAIYGVEYFKNYSVSIRQYKDGRALDRISTGLIILVASIIIGSLFGALRPWAIHDGWLSPYTIVANYLGVLPQLVAYSYIFAGSVELRRQLKRTPSQTGAVVGVAVVLGLIAIFYIKQLFEYKYITSTPNPSSYSAFYMSDVMVLLTIAIPFLLGWGLALKAALNLAEYSRSVKGIIYRGALSRLTLGILLVVAFYIIVQLLFAFSTYLFSTDLGSLLLVIYLILVLYAIGFLVIASGAKRLSYIEKAAVEKAAISK